MVAIAQPLEDKIRTKRLSQSKINPLRSRETRRKNSLRAVEIRREKSTRILGVKLGRFRGRELMRRGDGGKVRFVVEICRRRNFAMSRETRKPF